MEIEKAYFTLPEVLARWSMPEVDLVYLAENDQLRLSVRILNLPIEFGDFEGAVARLAAVRDRMGRGRRLARLLAGGLQRAALAEAGAMAGRLVPGLMSPLFDDSDLVRARWAVRAAAMMGLSL